jgi:signal recognition particle receptor subunit beta
MQSVKIVVTGSQRSGVTSFIRSVSEISALTTERRIPGAEPSAREIVIPMDFGRVTISDDVVLYLFGTPGEEDRSLVGGPFADGLIGIVVMVDTGRPQSIERASGIVALLRQNSDVPFVVAANQRADAISREMDLTQELGLPEGTPIIECNATDRSSAKSVVIALMNRILEAMS